MAKLLRVKLIRSCIGVPEDQRRTAQGLGLYKTQKVKVLLDTPAIRGMIRKIPHLVEVEAFEGDESLRTSARRDRKAAEASAAE